jgi:preprotein translocase subunit SecB
VAIRWTSPASGRERDGKQPQQQPQIAIQVNVNPNQLSKTDFEVALKVEGKAELTGTVLFAFDLNYAGVFRLTNIPQENVGPLLMIECPRLLFPFARELIASAISNGGFPPLMLPPDGDALQDAQRQLSGNDDRGNRKLPTVAGKQVAQIAGLGEVKHC